jgi:outer membrane biosynthesis protein TonB
MYAVQNWRFAPALKHGQPVVVRMRLPFTFRS